MSNSISDDATKNTSKGISKIPTSLAKRLLLSLIPHRYHDTEPGSDGGLTYTKEEPVSPETCVIMAHMNRCSRCPRRPPALAPDYRHQIPVKAPVPTPDSAGA